MNCLSLLFDVYERGPWEICPKKKRIFIIDWTFAIKISVVCVWGGGGWVCVGVGVRERERERKLSLPNTQKILSARDKIVLHFENEKYAVDTS